MAEKAKMVTFTFFAPDAGNVFIAGTFNDWSDSKHPLKKDRKGNWNKRLKLVPGKYEYKFIVDGEWVSDPENDESENNSLGSTNSILRV